MSNSKNKEMIYPPLPFLNHNQFLLNHMNHFFFSFSFFLPDPAMTDLDRGPL